MSNNPWPFVLVALSSLGFLANSMAEPQDGADARDAAEERLTQPVLKLDATNDSSEPMTPQASRDRFQPRSAVNPRLCEPDLRDPRNLPIHSGKSNAQNAIGYASDASNGERHAVPIKGGLRLDIWWSAVDKTWANRRHWFNCPRWRHGVKFSTRRLSASSKRNPDQSGGRWI